jgi:hypothetical protein
VFTKVKLWQCGLFVTLQRAMRRAYAGKGKRSKRQQAMIQGFFQGFFVQTTDETVSALYERIV